jgi:hypothetical protein
MELHLVSQDFSSREFAVTDVNELEYIRSKLLSATRHLDQAFALGIVRQSAELSLARAAYEAAIEYLPHLKVSGTSRVQLVMEVADVAARLRTAGIDV